MVGRTSIVPATRLDLYLHNTFEDLTTANHTDRLHSHALQDYVNVVERYA